MSLPKLGSRSIVGMITRGQKKALFSTEKLIVLHEPGEFTIHLDGHKAFLRYSQKGSTIEINHTEVPPVFRGKGVAKLLVLESFDYVAKHKMQMKIFCDYAEKIFKENQDQYKQYYIKN